MNSTKKSNLPHAELLSHLAPDDAVLDLVMIDPFTGKRIPISLKANIQTLTCGLSMFEGMIPLVHPELAHSGKVAFRVVRHALGTAQRVTRSHGAIWIKGDSVLTHLIPLDPPQERTPELEALFHAYGADIDDPVELPIIDWDGSYRQTRPVEDGPDKSGPSYVRDVCE
jgi:hypothetical protein